MANTDEQWKQGGDCTKCRRQKYCSKPCTLYKRIEHETIRGMVAEAMDRATGGALHDFIYKAAEHI